MEPTQAKKSEDIRKALAKEYKDANFRYPTEYTDIEAANFAKIQMRMFAKRGKLRADDGDKSYSPDDVYENDFDLLEAALPTAEGQEKFRLWVHTKDMIVRTMPKAGKAQDYFKALAQTDYTEKASLRAMFSVLKAYFYPYIPAGSYNGYRYRIIPSFRVLGPDEDKIDWTDTREIAAEPIIALNLVGQRIRYTDEKKDHNVRRRANSSEESYFSSSSTNSNVQSNDTTGFVGFQFGELSSVEEHYWSDDGKLPEGQDVGSLPWATTNWILVVVISADSTAGAVWLLQNFEPTIENTSDQYIIVPGNPDDAYIWGYFAGELGWDHLPVQSGGVKIAHKITDLSETSQWTMDEYITGKYDLVQAVLAERTDGKSPVIVRQLPKVEDDSSADVSRLHIED